MNSAVLYIKVTHMAFYSRTYIHQVSDFLTAGRLCGYVISIADRTNAFSISGVVRRCSTEPASP